jgi:hypothetical protein
MGKETVGIGRNLTDKGISREEAEHLARNDIAEACALLNQFPWYDGLTDNRKAALIERFLETPVDVIQHARQRDRPGATLCRDAGESDAVARRAAGLRTLYSGATMKDVTIQEKDRTMKRVALIIAIAFFCMVGSAVAQSVTVDYGSTTHTGSPNIFGMHNWPCNGSCVFSSSENYNYPGSTAMQQQMVDIGGTFVRSEAHFSQTVPNTTVSQYSADMSAGCPGGSTCDPNTWTWDGPSNTDGQVTEQLSAYPGVTLVLIAGGSPAWLSSGSSDGFPTDFTVYNDIQKKYFQHFNNISPVAFVEILPEPNTPPGFTPDQYATIYQNAVGAIRSISNSVRIGGPGVTTSCGGSDGTDCFQSYVTAMQATGAEIDYLSAHSYAGTLISSKMANIAQSAGVPAYITEWNSAGDFNDPANGDTSDSVSFIGDVLTQMINDGYVGSTYYSGGHYLFDDSSLYLFDTPTHGILMKKAQTWFLMAKQLGLGAGNFTVKSSSPSGVSAALGAVNAAGKPVVVVVNHTGSPVNANVTLNNLGLSGNVSLLEYLADHGSNDATSPILNGSANVSGGSTSFSISMTPFSTAGAILGGSVSPTPTPRPRLHQRPPQD